MAHDKYGMRNFINMITEGDVVPYKREPKIAEPSQDEKYRGAGAFKASGLGKDLNPDNPFHQHIGSLIQGYFTELAGGRDPDAKYKKQFQDVAAVLLHSAKMTVHSFIHDLQNQHNEEFPEEKINTVYANAASAYSDRDDTQAVDRVVAWGGKEIARFPNEIALYQWMVENILPKLSEPVRKHDIAKIMSELNKLLENPDIFKKDDFDPHVKGEWDQMSPYAERILNDLGPGKSSHSAYIYSPFEGRENVSLEFNSRRGPKRVIKFPDHEALEAYLRKNEDVLRAWVKRADTEVPNQPALIRRISASIVKAMEDRFHGRAIPVEFTDMDIDSLADQIENRKVRDVLDSYISHVRRMPHPEYNDDKAIYWFRKQVASALAGTDPYA